MNASTILINNTYKTFFEMASPNNPVEKRDDILGGTPVFKGTRVPVNTFFEYLQADHSLHDFLEDFPTVTRQQAIQVLERFKSQLLQPQ
jgi:uncharacterized protein (DUF433 family)